MSETEKSYTSVLLPGARVAFFTHDDTSKAAFLSFEKDWRFARIALEVYDGDVDTAIETYGNTTSPDLVIVQTDDVSGAFTAKLESLAGSCAEGTAAIVVGPVNDVNLYRKMVGMGVSDYLVKPLDPEAFANDVAVTLLEKVGAKDSRLIALMGAKGGVGTSVLAQALSWGLADSLGQKTFLMDAAGGWSTLSVGMDFEPATTLIEAGRAAYEGKEDSLTRMIHTAAEKLFVLSSGGDVMLDDPVSTDYYEALLDYLMAVYPFVVVDLSGAVPALKRTVCSRAHRIGLVTSPVLSSVRATRSLTQEIRELRGGSETDISLILNMRGIGAKNEVPKKQIQEGVEQDIIADIAFNPALFFKTEAEGRKWSGVKEGAVIVESLLPLVQDMLAVLPGGDEPGGKGKTGKQAGVLGGLLGKLSSGS
ncbi:MAG: type II secretion protein ATPase [Alphaproteobacteria bacterium]|nr:type II secretion protein ATPase [Alphaproteobacteria bacterium]